MASEAGKGDKRRPTDDKKFEANYDAIFGNKPRIRGSFVWDEIEKRMVPKEEFYANYIPPDAPMVMGDIQPYKSVVTGEAINSRSQHREMLKRHNLVEFGNEAPKRKEIQDVPGRREAIIEACRKHKVRGFGG